MEKRQAEQRQIEAAHKSILRHDAFHTHTPPVMHSSDNAPAISNRTPVLP